MTASNILLKNVKRKMKLVVKYSLFKYAVNEEKSKVETLNPKTINICLKIKNEYESIIIIKAEIEDQLRFIIKTDSSI